LFPYGLNVRRGTIRTNKPSAAGIEGRVQGTVFIQASNTTAGCSIIRSELSTHEYLAVDLHGETVDFIVKPRTRIKRRVQGTICVQPRDVVACHAIIGTKGTPYDNTTIARLYR
jgi:hypothetical protein